MALTFPLALSAAALAVNDCDFELDDANVDAPTWGRLYQSVNVGRRIWRQRYVTRPLREEEALALVADLRATRGGARTIRAQDPARRFCIAYPGGYGGMTKAIGGAFTGVAKLQAVAGTLDAVTLNELPNGFQLKKGDHLSFEFGSGRQALHSVVEAGTANASGIATVGVEPTLIPGYTLNANVALADPWCKARLVGSLAPPRRAPNRRYVVSFSAVQVLW